MGSNVEKGRIFPGDPIPQEQMERELERIGRELLAVYRRYNPEGTYLAITIINKQLEAHNRWWEADREKPLRMRGRYVG